MESWDELLKGLPSDEDLKKAEAEGKLDEVDRKLEELQKIIKEMKEKINNQQNNEIDSMFNDNKQDKEEEPKRIILN